MRALAISEQHRKYRSFSGGRIASLGNRRFSGIDIVIVWVAMMAGKLDAFQKVNNATPALKKSQEFRIEVVIYLKIRASTMIVEPTICYRPMVYG